MLHPRCLKSIWIGLNLENWHVEVKNIPWFLKRTWFLLLKNKEHGGRKDFAKMSKPHVILTAKRESLLFICTVLFIFCCVRFKGWSFTLQCKWSSVNNKLFVYLWSTNINYLLSCNVQSLVPLIKLKITSLSVHFTFLNCRSTLLTTLSRLVYLF